MMGIFGKLCLVLLVPAIVGAVDVVRKGDSMSDPDKTASELLAAADATFQARDYDRALHLYEGVVESARKEFNRSVEVEALSQVARMYLVTGKKEDGRVWLKRAEERADDADPMGWSRYLGVRGRFEWQDDSLDTARNTFNDMYVYCNTNALFGRAVDAAHMIAIVAEDPSEQIQWNYRGIEAAESAGEEQWLGPLWNNLAGTYFDMKNYDSALTCYRKAREYHWQFSGEVGKLFADYHVGMTLRYAGQFEEAAKWLRPVLAWAERLENHSAVGQACEDLGECQIAFGKKADGLALLKRAREEYRHEKWDEQLPDIWKALNARISELEK